MKVTLKQFIETINILDNDNLCWFTTMDFDVVNVKGDIIFEVLKKGLLIYDHKNEIFVGRKTFKNKIEKYI